MTARDEWRQAHEQAVCEEKPRETLSGIPLESAYGTAQSEWPGVYPYTRGLHPSMYRSRTWTMR
ncbi:MAG: methylmalonyl-CoA mutase family protein, partial [Actinobacteria bacterium]|nr:methylmalonyl-CoA mutase family protein [Actinomycetota bacterium]